jgi:hypothetical protein
MSQYYLKSALEEIKSKLEQKSSTFGHEPEKLIKEKYSKDIFKRYLKFRYTYKTLHIKIKDILIAMDDLISIDKKNEDRDSKDPKKSKRFLKKQLPKISFYTKSMLNHIASINNFIKHSNKDSNYFEEIEKMLRNYPEFTYIRKIRNKFIQHQKVSEYFEMTPTGSFRNREKFLPSGQIMPGSVSQALISSYYKEKICDHFLNLGTKEKIEKNKNDFLKTEKDKDFNEDLKNRIRVFGLPEIDQEKLSKEIIELFDGLILDKIEEEKKFFLDKIN